MRLFIITNTNDFAPVYILVDADKIKFQKREENVSAEIAAQKGLKVLRKGFFPHIVICQTVTEIPFSGHLQSFKSLKAAERKKRELERK